MSFPFENYRNYNLHQTWFDENLSLSNKKGNLAKEIQIFLVIVSQSLWAP